MSSVHEMETWASSAPLLSSENENNSEDIIRHVAADNDDNDDYGVFARPSMVPKGIGSIINDPVYESKANLLNKAIQEIGMGRYQWKLFIVVGFGWASDNLWPIVTSLILPSVVMEFKPSHGGAFLPLAQNIGLLVGAMCWGFGCDVFGRKLAFNLTIGITAVFGLIAASSSGFAALGIFAALWSSGVGGNLPVDSAIFLEFLPGSHQYLLTVLSVFWAVAQIFATLVACRCYSFRSEALFQIGRARCFCICGQRPPVS